MGKELLSVSVGRLLDVEVLEFGEVVRSEDGLQLKEGVVVVSCAGGVTVSVVVQSFRQE